MMNNNKILTVSYGTFSCTLEGFEDSFSTMKVIAEYFRDLAADDRYFGAEPPQPDADLLARIAQKEVARKVEAREQDGKIVLSAAAPAAVAAAASFVEMPQSEIEDAQMAEDEPVELIKEPAAETTEAEAAPAEATVEEASAKETTDDAGTDRIASETEEHAKAPAAEAEQTPETQESAEAKAPADVADAAELENEIVPGQPDDEVGAFFAASPTEDSFETEEATSAPTEIETLEAETVEVAAVAPESIAAKLQRIRAVVAQHEETDDDADYLEDEHAAEDGAVDQDTTGNAVAADVETPKDVETEDLMSDIRADIEDALEVDDAAEPAAVEAKDTSEESSDEVNAILERLDADTAKEVSAEDTVLDGQDDTDSEDTVQETVNNLFEAEDAKPAAVAAAPVVKPSRPLRKSREVTARVDPAQTDAKKAAARTRVIKVKRADLEAAIEKGDLEEFDTSAKDSASKENAPVTAAKGSGRALDDVAPAKSDESTLTADQQKELANELAAVESDIAVEAEKEQIFDKEEVKRAVTSRGLLPSLDEKKGSAVSRLLAETDHQMDEPESATRRDAFAHLRAAVAAKNADETMSDNGAEDSGDVYREDLAEVVRPRRALSGEPKAESVKSEEVPSETAQSERPAPLKLVAEQRISEEDTEEAAPQEEVAVKPRRVAGLTETAKAATDGGDFAEFAAEMGASTLPQLLEAAAAHMAFVEGREQFSRPQLMNKVRQASGQQDFSREDGLRSFGQLLRAGKIEKLKGGRFTVSDDIGFRPDQRAAG